MLADMIERLFDRHLDDAAQAKAREGVWLGEVWAEVEEMGLPLALLSEAQGGFGLDPADQGEALRLLGQHAVPLPVAETMGANRLFAKAGLALAEGPSGLARADRKGRLGRAARLPGSGSRRHTFPRPAFRLVAGRSRPRRQLSPPSFTEDCLEG
jgi:acyl-CoA dehydrogenase